MLERVRAIVRARLPWHKFCRRVKYTRSFMAKCHCSRAQGKLLRSDKCKYLGRPSLCRSTRGLFVCSARARCRHTAAEIFRRRVSRLHPSLAFGRLSLFLSRDTGHTFHRESCEQRRVLWNINCDLLSFLDDAS